MKQWTKLAWVFLISVADLRGGFAQEFRIPVRHDHTLGSCRGELIITAEGIAYRTEHRKHARQWRFEDIRLLRLASHAELIVLTYEPNRWMLGRDRAFRFRVAEKEIPPKVNAFLLSRIERPLATTFVPSSEEPIEEFAVRHRHRFGGCQGTLRVYAHGVAYVSSHRPRDSRFWRWSDIQGIGRLGPYQLDLVTYEPEFGGPTRTYVFDMKREMSETAYDFLWEKVYGIARHPSGNAR